MGSTGFLASLQMNELDGTNIGMRLYDCIKNIGTSSNQSQQKNYIDYHKYIKASAILSRGTDEDRLRLIYGIFDPRKAGKISKNELF